jgi:hypothetical protein
MRNYVLQDSVEVIFIILVVGLAATFLPNKLEPNEALSFHMYISAFTLIYVIGIRNRVDRIK